LVPPLALDPPLDRLFLVLDALLQLQDPLLSVLLLLLNVLHQPIKDTLALLLGFIGLPLLFSFQLKNLVLVPQAFFHLSSFDLGCYEVLLHPIKHVEVGVLIEDFFISPGIRFIQLSSQILEFRLYLVDWPFSLGLLQGQHVNFFFYQVQLL